MPTYEWSCWRCTRDYEVVCPVADRDINPPCPDCGHSSGSRAFTAPVVLHASYPDGLRRFDGVRKSRALDKAIKAEKDKAHKKRLQAEQAKLNKVG